MSTSYTVTTVGRVFLSAIEIQETQTVDAISFYNFATVAGNVRIGIYGPEATIDTPVAAPLAVAAADTALAGASGYQTITFTATTLSPGRYYLAFEFSDALHTFGRQAITPPIALWTTYFDLGAYLALPAAVPAVIATTTTPNAVLRVNK